MNKDTTGRAVSGRLDRGEYVSQSKTESTETLAARRKFVDAAERLIPEFFKKLLSDVYPEYARLAAGREDYWNVGWSFDHWQLSSDPDRELTRHLFRWAGEFNILPEETWIFERALQTMCLWLGKPERRESIYFFHPPIGRTTEVTPPFSFDAPDWVPQDEKWASYSAKVKQLFAESLRDYKEKVCAIMDDHGVRRSKARHSPRNFEWFVLYQLGGLSQGEIARRYTTANETPDVSTVRKGVHKVAELINWEIIRSSETPES